MAPQISWTIRYITFKCNSFPCLGVLDLFQLSHSYEVFSYGKQKLKGTFHPLAIASLERDVGWGVFIHYQWTVENSNHVSLMLRGPTKKTCPLFVFDRCWLSPECSLRGPDPGWLPLQRAFRWLRFRLVRLSSVRSTSKNSTCHCSLSAQTQPHRGMLVSTTNGTCFRLLAHLPHAGPPTYTLKGCSRNMVAF